MSETQALITAQPPRAYAVLTKDQRLEYWKQAVALIAANMFPDKFEKAEEAYMVALYGHELGLSPQRAWKQIHLIKGQPALDVHLQVAKVREHIPGLIWKIVEHTDQICVIEHGRSKDDIQRTDYTLAEGQASELPWATNAKAKNRRDMLYARAAGRAVRWFYPETQGGGLIHNVDEMIDATHSASPAGVVEGAQGRAPRRDPNAPLQNTAGGAGGAQVTEEAKSATVVDEMPAKPKDETEPPAAPDPNNGVDTEAVLDLVDQLSRAADLNEVDLLYGKWRDEHKDSPPTLIKGFDAKETRTRDLQTKPK